MKNWMQIGRANLLSLILMSGAGAFAQTVTTIHDFGGRGDGENPQAGVVFDQAGNLYGTAALGALDGNGVVYSLTPPEGGGVPWTESVLHKFQGQPDGAVPVCALVFFSGALFGTTEEGGVHNMRSSSADCLREYSFGAGREDF